MNKIKRKINEYQAELVLALIFLIIDLLMVAVIKLGI